MATSTNLLAATEENRRQADDRFMSHCSSARVDSNVATLSLIRSAYGDYHVTEVDAREVALLEYAAADNAAVVFDGEDTSFHAMRTWHPVGEGVAKKMHPGKLDDAFRFARFQYTWQDKEFLIYFSKWTDPWEGSVKRFYVLHPRAGGDVVGGHCAATDALVLAAGKWTSQPHEEVYVYDNGYWEKSKELWTAIEGASWEDVILDPEMKKGLIEDVQGFFDNQSLYAQFAMPWKRGVILHGVPGNGKTVSIKALMNALYRRADSIPSLYVKSFETNCNTEQYAIREIFQKARSKAPCLLIFEDLDSLVNDDVRSYFLNEVDGLESNDGILMIGSTNHLDQLDPAISKRPSRFDRKYHFKIPGEEERRLYANYWRKKLLKNETVEFPEELCGVIAQLSEGFSFAYLKELFVMALLSLVRGFKEEDFEIVEAGPGAEDDTAATPDETEDVCTCKVKCTTCQKPLPGAETENEEAAETKDKEQKKMTMPAVDIPDHLSDNLLLKIVQYQIRMLHAEMDNTSAEPKSEEKASGKKGRKACRTRRAC